MRITPNSLSDFQTKQFRDLDGMHNLRYENTEAAMEYSVRGQ